MDVCMYRSMLTLGCMNVCLMMLRSYDSPSININIKGMHFFMDFIEQWHGHPLGLNHKLATNYSTYIVFWELNQCRKIT